MIARAIQAMAIRTQMVVAQVAVVVVVLQRQPLAVDAHSRVREMDRKVRQVAVVAVMEIAVRSAT